MDRLAGNVDVCGVEAINRILLDAPRVGGFEDLWQKIWRCDNQGRLRKPKEMVNLKELVGRVGSDIDASSANDGEEDGRVQVL
jgi:hypothetical protein